jgi:hypothetical protein
MYLCYSLVIYLHNLPRKSKIKHKPETSSEIDSHTEDISKHSKNLETHVCQRRHQMDYQISPKPN